MNSLSELRKFLLDTIPEIKNGNIDTKKAKAICAVANSVVNLTWVEMDYLENSQNEIPFLEEPEMAKFTLEDSKPYRFSK